MAYYAKVNNGIVEKVIVAEASYFDSFVDSSPGTWIETSQTGAFRGNYAGIGMTYMKNVATIGVASTDIFITQQPYPSWTVGVNTAQWYPPTAMPTDGKNYVWNESSKSWDEQS